jgi:hypothetical protein
MYTVSPPAAKECRSYNQLRYEQQVLARNSAFSTTVSPLDFWRRSHLLEILQKPGGMEIKAPRIFHSWAVLTDCDCDDTRVTMSPSEEVVD